MGIGVDVATLYDFSCDSNMREYCQTLEDWPELTMRHYLSKAQFAVFFCE